MEDNQFRDNEEENVLFVEHGKTKEDKKRALFALCSALKELHNNDDD
ncbi:MAG: hypothetical protein MJ229_02540 [bacterium]|nr:hypothetical protein [bacterium]